MTLHKTNGATIDVNAQDIVEFWVHEGTFTKVVVQVDEATRTTYNIDETPEQISTLALAEGVTL